MNSFESSIASRVNCKLADEVVPIADGDMPSKKQTAVVDGQTITLPDTPQMIARDNARIKARIWKAGRMAPRKWGDLVDEEDDMGTITPTLIVIRSSADVRDRTPPKTVNGKGHDSD
jgi:hypothetical protein